MIEVFSHSEAGGHIQNEDAFEIRPLSPEAASYFCVVADGQGGQPGGGEAARIACRTCAESATRLDLRALLVQPTWHSLLRAVDQSVTDAPNAGYTTVVALAVSGSSLAGASCGDSAAALFQGDGTMTVLTGRQHKNPPVGSGLATFVPFVANLIRPWTVLAMSDGVWKYVGWERIAKAAAQMSGEHLVALLLQHAGLRGGGLQDDFTLVGFASADGAPPLV